MTFSGQVAWHSPHCTQASSAKRSIGRSGSSDSAPVGQAETQERHSVQPSTLTSTVPNGAPCGSAHDIDRRWAPPRAARASACRTTSRLRPAAEKVAGLAAPSIGAMARRLSPSASGSSVSMVATRAPAKPRPARIGSASAMVLARPAMSWRGLARTRKRTARGAVGERRGDRFQSDLRHFVDLHRQHIRRQSVAVARQRVDQFAAMLAVVEHHHRLLAAGLAVGARAARAICAAAHRTAAAHRPRRRSGRRRRIARSRRRSAHRSRRDRRWA